MAGARGRAALGAVSVVVRGRRALAVELHDVGHQQNAVLLGRERLPLLGVGEVVQTQQREDREEREDLRPAVALVPGDRSDAEYPDAQRVERARDATGTVEVGALDVAVVQFERDVADALARVRHERARDADAEQVVVDLGEAVHDHAQRVADAGAADQRSIRGAGLICHLGQRRRQQLGRGHGRDELAVAPDEPKGRGVGGRERENGRGLGRDLEQHHERAVERHQLRRGLERIGRHRDREEVDHGRRRYQRQHTGDLGERDDHFGLGHLIAREVQCFDTDEEPGRQRQHLHETGKPADKSHAGLVGVGAEVHVRDAAKAVEQHDADGKDAQHHVGAPEDAVARDVDEQRRAVEQRPDQRLQRAHPGVGERDHLADGQHRVRDVRDVLERLAAADHERRIEAQRAPGQAVGAASERQRARDLGRAAAQRDVGAADEKRPDQVAVDSGRQAGVPAEVLAANDDRDAQQPDVGLAGLVLDPGLLGRRPCRSVAGLVGFVREPLAIERDGRRIRQGFAVDHDGLELGCLGRADGRPLGHRIDRNEM